MYWNIRVLEQAEADLQAILSIQASWIRICNQELWDIFVTIFKIVAFILKQIFGYWGHSVFHKTHSCYQASNVPIASPPH